VLVAGAANCVAMAVSVMCDDTSIAVIVA